MFGGRYKNIVALGGFCFASYFSVRFSLPVRLALDGDGLRLCVGRNRSVFPIKYKEYILPQVFWYLDGFLNTFLNYYGMGRCFSRRNMFNLFFFSCNTSRSYLDTVPYFRCVLCFFFLVFFLFILVLF